MEETVSPISRVLLAQTNTGEDAAIPIAKALAEIVVWCADNLEWIFDAIFWPFEKVTNRFFDPSGFFLTMSPWWLVGAILVIGLVKGPPVAAVKATLAMAVTIGLGAEVSMAAVEGFGYILTSLAAVLVVATPLGLALGRWRSPKPYSWVLERLGLVPVWMLQGATIFLFGIGTAASMVLAVVVALPVAVYFTAAAPPSDDSFNRVVAGLQKALLPILWTYIMTAMMGSGGLGLVVFRAVTNLDLEASIAAGLGVLLVGYTFQQLLEPRKALRRKPAHNNHDSVDVKAVVDVPLTPKPA